MNCRFLFLVSFFSIFVFLGFGCKRKAFDKNEYAQLLREHPATDIRNYPQRQGKWTDRVYNLDNDRSSYIRKLNEIDGFTEVPVISSSMTEMKQKVEVITKSFHPKINNLFDKYLYGIYFCEKLGGTGVTGFIYDNSTGDPLGGFIVIDSQVIQKKANDWITYKERSAFGISEISLNLKIENEIGDTVENALRYILLHEMGHVISNTLRITPDLRDVNSDYRKFPFFDQAWTSMEKSIYDKEIFPLRPSIKFYGLKADLLNLDQDWNQIYPKLEKTNFPTLYGATNALDHFAESFVSYVHCIIDNRPWELTLSKDNKILYKSTNRIFEMPKEKEFIRKIVFEE